MDNFPRKNKRRCWSFPSIIGPHLNTILAFVEKFISSGKISLFHFLIFYVSDYLFILQVIFAMQRLFVTVCFTILFAGASAQAIVSVESPLELKKEFANTTGTH